MGAGDYIEIHDDFFVFKQGRKSPRKVYWKEISGLAFSGNKHFLPFSVMNVFEETGNMEPQTIVLLDSTYEQYKIAARVSQYRCKIRGVFKLIKKQQPELYLP